MDSRKGCPCRFRLNKLVQISRANNIRPYRMTMSEAKQPLSLGLRRASSPCRWALNRFYGESNISAPFIASCGFDIRRKSPGRHSCRDWSCFMNTLLFILPLFCLRLCRSRWICWENKDKSRHRRAFLSRTCPVVVVARIVIDIGLQYLRYLQRYFLICHFIASAVFIYILPPK